MVGPLALFAETSAELEGQITSYGLRTVGVSALLLIALVILGALIKDKHPQLKLPVFAAITTVIVGSTLFLFASTIYLNVVSDSGGPVHWHADLEFWACGSEIELKDPTAFLSNKIGSPVLHEHDDHRIHLEGVVVKTDRDASLGHFMKIIGGSLERGRMTIPLNDSGSFLEDEFDGDQPSNANYNQLESYARTTANGDRYLELLNGQDCGIQPAEVQVFVYQFNQENDTYQQIKLEDPKSYVYSPYSNVPPGDCVIFEFDVPKNYTDKLCKQYGLKDEQRCVDYGVSEFNPKQCNIQDVTDYQQSSIRENSNISQPQDNDQSAEEEI